MIFWHGSWLSFTLFCRLIQLYIIFVMLHSISLVFTHTYYFSLSLTILPCQSLACFCPLPRPLYPSPLSSHLWCFHTTTMGSDPVTGPQKGPVHLICVNTSMSCLCTVHHPRLGPLGMKSWAQFLCTWAQRWCPHTPQGVPDHSGYTRNDMTALFD